MPALLRCQRAFALTAAALMAATLFLVSTGAAPAEARMNRHHRILHAVRTVNHQIGDSYQWGATGPNRFDCSGLMKFALSRNNVYVPRTSGAQADFGRRVKRRNMLRGDFMVFHNRGDVYHIGMFVGRRRNGTPVMVHASRPGVPVRRAVPWTNSWYPVTLRRR
ncbi:MAG TPA: NlpC/P60 family protein [Nocardioidaceae bacterium]|nr:NlpC/P60 family protein [Nocardioidaceae bacterium]